MAFLLRLAGVCNQFTSLGLHVCFWYCEFFLRQQSYFTSWILTLLHCRGDECLLVMHLVALWSIELFIELFIVHMSFLCAGCKGGLGKGEMSETLAAGGGGHGGKGGRGYFNGSVAEGGIEYGDQSMPCELGSGSGNSSVGLVTSGGGIIGRTTISFYFFHLLPG